MRQQSLEPTPFPEVFQQGRTEVVPFCFMNEVTIGLQHLQQEVQMLRTFVGIINVAGERLIQNLPSHSFA